MDDERAAAGRESAARRGVDVEVEVDVAIVDVHRDIASATVHSSACREYLHLARTVEGWRSVNALWAPS